jgi:pimeloyl-ACP methyl ester carboxylesterase
MSSVAKDPTPTAVPSERRQARGVVFAVSLGVLGCLAYYVPSYVRAARLLQVMDPSSDLAQATLGLRKEPRLDSSDKEGAGDHEPTGYWFLPKGIASTSALEGDTPTVVLVHGLQREGAKSPRLQRLGWAFAAQGYAVFAPELPSLADYRLDPAAVAMIENSFAYAKRVSHRANVGVFGVSFGGGMALLAASRHDSDIAFVATLGGYADARRVARFLLEACAVQINGQCKHQTPHDYGAVVFIYTYTGDFFDAADRDLAHEALRLWLHEKFDEARAIMPKLSSTGRERLGWIFAKETDKFRASAQRAVTAHTGELEAISVEGKAKALQAPVFVLHAAGDPVVPDTEVAFLGAQLPNVGATLVSHALGHAEVAKSGPGEKLRLVQFVAAMLRAAK